MKHLPPVRTVPSGPPDPRTEQCFGLRPAGLRFLADLTRRRVDDETAQRWIRAGLQVSRTVRVKLPVVMIDARPCVSEESLRRWWGLVTALKDAGDESELD